MNIPFPSVVDDARQPFVVIVDDEDQGSFAELVRDLGVEAIALSPDDLDRQLLDRATTVVLDQYLDIWPGRDRQDLPVALNVPDGLGLAAVLRSHVEGSGVRTRPRHGPVAFALRTGEMDRLGAGLPAAAREHLLARQYNLEWVFSKGVDPFPNLPSPAHRVAALARATSTLPSHWGPDSHDPGLAWLDLPVATWTEDARWQIEQCRPPQHAVAERTAGLAWLRWFLQRILPFPTFLLDRIHLAIALGLRVTSVDDVIHSDSPLAARLEEVRYHGPLSDFLGDRWWRAGVSYLAEESLQTTKQGGVARIQAITVGLANLHGRPVDAITVRDPVVGLNADYTALPVPLSAASAVRLQPDDWPPYADDAWASRDALSGEDVDPELLALVVSTDRWRIHEHYDTEEHAHESLPKVGNAEEKIPEDRNGAEHGKRLS